MRQISPGLILIDPMADLGDLKRLNRILSERSADKNSACLYWSAFVHEILNNKYTLSYEYGQDYLAQNELDGIEGRIWDWLCSWYEESHISRYRAFIFYENFPISNFIDNELVNLFIYCMKSVGGINKFIENNISRKKSAVVISKTEVFSSLCEIILKKNNVSYEIYRLKQKDSGFYQPIFFNWGKLPNFRASLISSVCCFIEFISNINRRINRRAAGSKRLAIVDHRVFKPVIGRISEEDYDIFLVNNPKAFLFKKSLKQRIYYLNTFSSIRLDLFNYLKVRLKGRAAKHIAEKLIEEIHVSKKGQSFFNYSSIDFFDVVRVPMLNMFSKFPVFSNVCGRIDRKLKDNKIDFFLTNSSIGESRYYWHACRQSNITNACYLHGIEIMNKFYKHNNNQAEHLLAWGTKMYEQGLKRGQFDNKKHFIIGNMTYDSLKNNVLDRKELDLRQDEKIILFDYFNYNDFSFSCLYSTDYSDRVLLSMLRILKKFQKIALIIKVHPISSPASVLKLIEYLKPEMPVRVLHKVDIMSLIPICDVVVSPGATTLCLDSVVNKVPFVAANFTKVAYLPFKGYKAFIEVFNDEELEKALRDIIYDPNSLERYNKYGDEFISDFCYRLDGQSTTRFVTTIEQILKN